MPQIATGFGGGISRQGQICGAFSGAIMAIGLRCGRVAADDLETKENVYKLVSRFLDECRHRFGGVGCVELLGCDIGTADGMLRFKEHDLHTEVCARALEFAAEQAYRLLVRGS